MSEIYHVADHREWDNPVIDEEKEDIRVLSDGTRYPFHYVHGHFEGTDVKFLFALPPKEQFKLRFFQYLSPFPGPDEEVASLHMKDGDDRIAFDLSVGAAFVESNMGSTQTFGPKKDDTIVWKASAAVAEYFRSFAMKYYGCSRPFGYVHGGSGGGYKTLACIENTDAFDGAVPYAIGTPYSVPNSLMMHANGQRVLRHAFKKIVKALDAGGSGDPYAELNEEESAMLREVTLMGFPPQSWFLEANGLIDPGSVPVLLPGIRRMDPIYFTDFWTKEGYDGADPASTSVRDRIDFDAIVCDVTYPGQNITHQAENSVNDAWMKQLADGSTSAIRLDHIPEGDLYFHGVELTILSGPKKGVVLSCDHLDGDAVVLGMSYGITDLNAVLKDLKPGDQVHISNADFIAGLNYYRYQVPPEPEFHAWDQFRNADGTSATPTRPVLMGPGFTGTGTRQSGNIQGKVIMIEALMDEFTWPWSADWYRTMVRKSKGNEDDYRLYYMERCMHGDLTFIESNMVTNYVGAMREALLMLDDWVQYGKEPLPTTGYTMDGGHITVEKDVRAHKGVQPLIHLTGDGSDHVTVRKGEKLTLTVEAEVPEGAGYVNSIAWAADSHDMVTIDGNQPECFTTPVAYSTEMVDGIETAHATFEVSYDEVGDHYASARVRVNREGNAKDHFIQIGNIARCLVTVTE